VRSRPDAHLSTVPSDRMTCHTVRTPDRPSIIPPDKVYFRPDLYCIKKLLFQLASVQTPLSDRSASDSFQVQNKGRLIHPSGRWGFPSGRAPIYGKQRNSNITARTSVSLGPNARATNMEIADSTSTARTPALHGPDACISNMEILC